MKINGQYECEAQEFKASLSEMDKGIVSLVAMLNKNGKGKVFFWCGQRWRGAWS